MSYSVIYVPIVMYGLRLFIVALLVGECSALWASGSDPADASADVSMHTAHAGERTTQR